MKKRDEDNTILIIEDEADIRTFTCRVLELEGYICLGAETGGEAFRLLSENTVNLVLLDLRLPGESGWSLLARLKSNKATSSIPVIVFTASYAEQQRSRALESGAAEYLIKPMSTKVLKEVVARFLPLEKQ